MLPKNLQLLGAHMCPAMGAGSDALGWGWSCLSVHLLLCLPVGLLSFCQMLGQELGFPWLPESGPKGVA